MSNIITDSMPAETAAAPADPVLLITGLVRTWKCGQLVMGEWEIAEGDPPPTWRKYQHPLTVEIRGFDQATRREVVVPYSEAVMVEGDTPGQALRWLADNYKRLHTEVTARGIATLEKQSRALAVPGGGQKFRDKRFG